MNDNNNTINNRTRTRTLTKTVTKIYVKLLFAVELRATRIYGKLLAAM